MSLLLHIKKEGEGDVQHHADHCFADFLKGISYIIAQLANAGSARVETKEQNHKCLLK